MKKVIFIILIIILSSCKKNDNQFSLSGKVDEIKDGEYLFLHDLVENKTLDSAIVKNNEFLFKTELPNSPLLAMLHNKNRSIYRHIWLEKNKMTFNSMDTVFNYAEIIGSESHKLEKDFYKTADKDRSERLKETKVFIDQHPNSIISAYMLSNNLNTWGSDNTKLLFSKFSENVKITHFGKIISDFLETVQVPKIGEHAIDFEMTDINGNSIKLSDLKGKVVLLEFWASWCKPCREENPKLLNTYKKFHPNGFEILAVSLDTNKELWINAIKQDSLDWIHVSNLSKNSIVEKLYGVKSIPDNYLIDQNMIIIENKIVGDELEDKLLELLPATNKS